MLYPSNTASRTTLSLDGLWEFQLLQEKETYDVTVPLRGGRPMPVPCAYNDMYEGREFRDHVGWVVYERTFTVSSALREGVLLLRFGSVTHHAEVYLDGALLGSHKGGFLPFAFDITDLAGEGEHRLTVLVNNIVDHSTLPCGTIQRRQYPGMGEKLMNFPNFDFFNYSGILRPVVLYALPKAHIRDITVWGEANGRFAYRVEAPEGELCVRVLDDSGAPLWESKEREGEGTLPCITPWSPDHPVLYRLQVELRTVDGGWDTYTEEFGFRTVEVAEGELRLNGKKLYLRGFGKHEDAPVIGRGFSEAYNVKDLGLLQWMHANSFRTSHYPYSEEMMRLCDRLGILVIDETPAVGMHTTFTATGMQIDVASPTWSTLTTAEHHADVLRDLVARDKNHPCVIMWSVANEPASEEKGAYDYFKPLFDLTCALDPQHRPVTFATHCEATVETCGVASLCDVITLNRYYGWYSEEGNIPAAKALLGEELDRYHERYPDKPILLGEFGADTVAGLHDTTAQMFSEEYQRDLIDAYCQVFDERSYMCGEHIWNFADFATAESVKRVQGNKKGVFTRERKPKLVAWYLKDRWGRMAEESGE